MMGLGPVVQSDEWRATANLPSPAGVFPAGEDSLNSSGQWPGISKGSGEMNAAAYVVVTTIAGIGMIVGLSTLRDQIVQEYGDVALALESLDQSYHFTVPGPNCAIESKYEDTRAQDVEDVAEVAPAGLDLSMPAVQEGGALPAIVGEAPIPEGGTLPFPPPAPIFP